MRIHRICDVFPEMGEKEFSAFVEDIKTSGIREPVWTWKGEIVDGRHRWRACEVLRRHCPTREWNGKGSLMSFVISQNLHRRHMSASQRAVIAERSLPYFEAEAAERKREAGKRGSEGGRGKRKNPSGKNASRVSQARDQAAASAGVSGRMVSDAKKLRKKSPELAKDVERGDLSLPAALSIASLPSEAVDSVRARSRDVGSVRAVEEYQDSLCTVESAHKRLKVKLGKCVRLAGQLLQEMQSAFGIIRDYDIQIHGGAGWFDLTSKVALLVSTFDKIEESHNVKANAIRSAGNGRPAR